jgi:hypothetical protein
MVAAKTLRLAFAAGKPPDRPLQSALAFAVDRRIGGFDRREYA